MRIGAKTIQSDIKECLICFDSGATIEIGPCTGTRWTILLWSTTHGDSLPHLPLWRPGNLSVPTASVEEAFASSIWTSTTHRGGELRTALDRSSHPERWPVDSLPSIWWKWKVVVSFRQSGQHINCLEMRAILAALKWRVRQLGEIGITGVHLSDSGVCLACLSKGRSSSTGLNFILHRINILKIAASLILICAHVRSADNPADHPAVTFG